MTASSAEPDSRDSWRGPLYLDASALLKLYLPETGSDDLDARLTGRRDLLVSDLGITEIVSAFSRRRREGQVSDETARALRNAILEDVDAEHFGRIELSSAAHREAERLLLSASVPLRAADSLHLALALVAGASGVVTFDRTMIAAASPLGLSTLPE
jgi:predicted nucleic acid-binding protein